jgi:predicted nucleic acid-binding protein
MILVDSTVWIDYFNGNRTAQSDKLDTLIGKQDLLVGDLIVTEVLQGFRDDRDFDLARKSLLSFNLVPILSLDRAVRCAQNYRTLRKMGITVRKTIDGLIATYCIETHTDLLHADRDFDPFELHLGLSVIHC